jgi:hypothetical protein
MCGLMLLTLCHANNHMLVTKAFWHTGQGGATFLDCHSSTSVTDCG